MSATVNGGARRFDARLVALVLLAAASALVGTGREPVGAQLSPPVWWAMGDSYASGEGIPGTDASQRGRDPDGDTCERANGSTGDAGASVGEEPSEAKAWSVVAYEELFDVSARQDALTVVACTGATTDDLGWQVDQARAWSGVSRPDVISFSFGGNDVGFAGVLGNCLGLPFVETDRPDVRWGCDHTDAELRARVEDVVAADHGPVADVLDATASTVLDGGHVMVVGYPHLVEEPERWPTVNRYLGSCQGILAADARMLRGVNGLINQRLSEAVDAAARRNPGIAYHWVDPNPVYEGSDARHALCSSEPWLNGLTLSGTSGDIRPDRSFHPTQAGHRATGSALAVEVRATGGAEGLTVPTPDLVADAQGIAGFEFRSSGSDVVDALTARLGPPDADSGVGVDDCTGGESRSVHWAGLTVLLSNDPAAVDSELQLAGWTIDASAGGAPEGLSVDPPIDGSTSWADLQALGATWDDFYGTWEIGDWEIGGSLSTGTPDPAAVVMEFGAGSSSLKGC